MDITKIQTLIAQGKIVNAGDIDPDTSYLQVGVWQEGNRQKGAAGEAYPSYAIAVSQIAPAQIIDVLGTSLYSTSPAAGPNLSPTDNIYLGGFAGENTSGIFRSIFLGTYAGANASAAWLSHFIGDSAGRDATDARFSNFIGKNAGITAIDARYSNFIGPAAGQSASNAYESNFIGYNSGLNATSAYRSNFIGRETGQGATNANNSNFIGDAAGRGSTNASNSIFIGRQAGRNAPGVTYSVFIGEDAGLNSTASNVVAIGKSVAIGNTLSGQFIVGANNMPVYAGLAAATTALSGGVTGNRYLWIDSTDDNTVKAYIP
jgi:hypothetical protein